MCCPEGNEKKVVDRFHDYLDYCENVELVSVGDYIEKVVQRSEVLAWTHLMRDVRDTFNAGKLQKIPLDNGGAAYVRKGWRNPGLPNIKKLPPTDTLVNTVRKEP